MPAPSRPFETVRTRQFLSEVLSTSAASTIGHIEQFGCEVIHVRNEVGPGWSYTVGVHDTCGQPEVITVGLPTDTAHYLLNESARLLREGVELRGARQRGLVGEVECEFQPVDQRWVDHLMGQANWFNGDTEFPVLQAIYPDLENRFPPDPEFDVAFAQPLLQPGSSFGKVERDFWASADPESGLFDWKFPDPPNTAVFLSKAVRSGREAITYVSHDAEDGAWQLLGDSMPGGELPVISCFHHSVDNDPTLKDLADLPLGWWAERASPGDPWVRHQHEPDDDSDSSIQL